MTYTLESDNFNRTVSGSWGTASDANAWVMQAGTGTISTNGTRGTMTTPASQATMILGSTSTKDVEAQCDISIGNAADAVGVSIRWVNSSNWYRVDYSGAGQLRIRKNIAGVTGNIAAAAFSPTVGTLYTYKIRISNGMLYAKAWIAGNAEPDWMLSGSDSNLTSGNWGVIGSPSTGSTLLYDNFQVNQAMALTEQARVKFSEQVRGLTAISRDKFLVQMRGLNTRARSAFDVQVKGMLTPSHNTFNISKALNTRARSKFLVRTSLTTKVVSRFYAQVKLSSSARSGFSPRTSLSSLARTKFQPRLPLSSAARSRFLINSVSFYFRIFKASFAESQRINASFAEAEVLNASFSEAAPINASFAEVLLARPFSTINSSATVVDANGNPINNLTSVSVVITFPDQSTTTILSASFMGSGVYQIQYNTKMQGFNREVWSFIGADGSIAQYTNITPVSS